MAADVATPQSHHHSMNHNEKKADTTRKAVAAVATPAEQNQREDIALMDVDAMLETMKTSARRLDTMLQKMCEASDESPGGENESGAVLPAELLAVDELGGEKERVTPAAYFQAIERSFQRAEDGFTRRLAPHVVRGLQGRAGAVRALDGKTFRTRSADVTYMFPAPAFDTVDNNGADEDSDAWDMTEPLLLDEFRQRVAQCLEATDHSLPSELGDRMASGVAAELAQTCSTELVLKAVETMFPTERVHADTQIEWRCGNRVCKVLAVERERRHQWGIELAITLETVARAQAHPIALSDHDQQRTPQIRLGPALSCVFDSRLFVPKTAYTTTEQVIDVSPTTTLQFSPVKEPDPPTPAETRRREEANASAEDAEDSRVLPEFLNVYQWGGHAQLSPDFDSSFAVPATFDRSRGFQKLEILSPFPRNRIVQAACGRLHTLLLNDVGMVFSYGHAMDGALGHGDTLRRTEVFVAQPKLIDFFFEKAVTVRTVACGGDALTGFHSAAVASDGRVYTWGVGIALGLGSVKSKSTPELVAIRLTPPVIEVEAAHAASDVATPEPPRVVSVACGSGFCVALASDGSAFAWGKWSDGRLGLGAIPILNKSSRQHGNRRQLQRFQLYPKRLAAISTWRSPSPVRWRKVSCGDAHCVAITRDGHLYVWGRGKQGQLGLGDVRDAMAPVRLSKKPWRDVATGQDWSIAVDKQGRVWSWGACGASVLGLASGDDADRSATIAGVLLQKNAQLQHQTQAGAGKTARLPPRFHWLRPQPLSSLSHGDVEVRSLSAGVRHAAAISTRGDLYVWGSPEQGLSSQPTLVTSAASAGSSEIGATIAEQVFCGGSQIITLTSGSFLARAMQLLYSTLLSANEGERDAGNEPQPSQGHRLAGADVMLILSGGRALLAHKLVLARRSPVLRELVLNEERPLDSARTSGTESATPSLTELLLPQLRIDVARILLEFLYTDNLTESLDPLSFLVRDVLRAAREYEIPLLVQICRDRIARASYMPVGTLLADIEAEEEEQQQEPGWTDDGRSHTLNGDLAFAFGDATWSDVRIVAETRAIPVHRCMLVARSEYFRALLAFHNHQTTTVETTTTTTDRELVVEESYLGMLRVLNFIYHDELTTLARRRPNENEPTEKRGRDGLGLEGDDEHTNQLLEDLIAADKYGLVRMKRLCEHHVVVTRANCLDVLVVADLVHADHLKQVALAFVQTNLHVLNEPVGPAAPSVLQRLAREFPHLLTELFDRIHRHTQQQTLLRDWQKQVERDVAAQREAQNKQREAASAATAFPWVPLILAFVFATLYLSVMNAQESDYPVVPAINLVVIAGLLAAAFMGKL